MQGVASATWDQNDAETRAWALLFVLGAMQCIRNLVRRGILLCPHMEDAPSHRLLPGRLSVSNEDEVPKGRCTGIHSHPLTLKYSTIGSPSNFAVLCAVPRTNVCAVLIRQTERSSDPFFVPLVLLLT